MKNMSYNFIIFFLIFGVAVSLENYVDYGEENANKNLENLREFYRFLLRHNSYDNSVKSPVAMDYSPYEHLMIRKSQRSPSLRLRFGRSDPTMPQAKLLMRSGSSVTSYEDK